MNHNSKEEVRKADLCISLEKMVSEILIEKSEKALKEYGLDKIVVCGGVSANSYIREEFEKLNREGIEVYFPDFSLCTDNAAMIAAARI